MQDEIDTPAQLELEIFHAAYDARMAANALAGAFGRFESAFSAWLQFPTQAEAEEDDADGDA